MAILKMRDIRAMNEKDLQERLKELRFELTKHKAGKETKVKAKEIKKAIARILILTTRK